MYLIDWNAILGRLKRGKGDAQAPPQGLMSRVSPTVWALGFTSLLTDVSSEMVASVLPMYLVLQLGISPVAFGVIDGIYQGIAALVRILGGVLGDRWRRYKEMAAFGYGISALCRLLILVAGTAWTTIAAVVAVDRIGKGLRTAPRDALISLRTSSENLATAFGVHRGLDAVGAFLGPILAFVLLAKMPGRFDILFVASFVVAVLGLAVIVLFVDANRPAEGAVAVAKPQATEAIGLLRRPGFRDISLCAFLLGVPTISDSFIFLAIQTHLHSAATAFPLFYVGTSISTAMLAVPVGRLADAAGRTRVLIAGYALLLLVYVSVLNPTQGVAGMMLSLLLLGGYYAATDGVLTAMAAAVLPPSATGSGLAFLATVTNIARFAASVLFGILWSTSGMRTAIATYLVFLVVATAMSAVILGRSARMASTHAANS